MASKQPYSQKTIFIIASCILLAIVGAWHLLTTGNRQQTSYFTPTGMKQSPTNIEQIIPATNWKTYTNNKYDYTVMYPPTFSAQDARDGDNSWFHRTMICHCTPETIGGFNGPVVIEVIDNPKGQSIEEILKSVLGFQGDPQFKSIMVAGIASKRTTVLPGLISGDSVFLSKGDEIFDISLVGNPSQMDISTTTFNQILSTFKFITP